MGGADPDVATARQKFHCPACGAEAQWNPSKHALICPFCGTESPVQLSTREANTEIAEHDLLEALRGVGAIRGWRADKASARCQSCQAISVFDATTVGRRCDFCGSTQLVPYEQTQDAFTPESLVPLKLSEAQARDTIRGWYRRVWFAPNALRSKALTDTAKGVYLPYWTFDASAHAAWTAESGTYYYTREDGKQVRRVRWTPASGELSHVFDDALVSASTGVKQGLLSRVEPFPTTALVPYDPGYLAGWTVERYQVDLSAAAVRARQQMEATLRQLCSSAVPGDTQRNLNVRATFTNQRFKHILVPVWLMTYTLGATSYQVVVNGATGQVAGTHPWSWVKIALLALVIATVFLLYALNQR